MSSKTLPKHVYKPSAVLVGVIIFTFFVAHNSIKLNETFAQPRSSSNSRQRNIRTSRKIFSADNKYIKLLRHTIVLRSQAVAYCSVPKINCSNMRMLMRKREGFSNWCNRSFIHANSGLLSASMMPDESVQTVLYGSEYYRFYISRNPFARLVSAYENKINRKGTDNSKLFKGMLRNECPGLTLGEFISFSEFVECVTSAKATNMNDPHWRPQCDLCRLDAIKYDKIISLENIKEDIRDLFEDLGWENDIDTLMLDTKPSGSKAIKSYYSDLDIERVLKYYADDFKFLNYSHTPTGNIEFYSSVQWASKTSQSKC